jgi:RNase P/RNase MRP subunit p30
MYIIYRLPLSEQFITKAIYTNLVSILSHKVTSLTHNYLSLKFHANFLKIEIRYTKPIEITTTGKAVD